MSQKPKCEKPLFRHNLIFSREYQSPYRLDISHKSDSLVVHVKAIISTRQLPLSKFQFRLPALPFELYPRERKWLVVSIYIPPLDSLPRFPYSTGA